MQIDGEFAAEDAPLNALHIAEAAIGENDDTQIQIILCRRRQFLEAPAKAAVTDDGNGALAGGATASR